MGKHTPGPWRLIARDESHHAPIVQRGMDGGFVVSGLSEEREDADARLIAAAPELLALLIRYRNEVPLGHQPHMAASEADALIAKATGESHG